MILERDGHAAMKAEAFASAQPSKPGFRERIQTGRNEGGGFRLRAASQGGPVAARYPRAAMKAEAFASAQQGFAYPHPYRWSYVPQ